MSDKENKIKDLEEIVGKQYTKILELSKVADRALSELEVRGYGASAWAIRQDLNKLKP